MRPDPVKRITLQLGFRLTADRRLTADAAGTLRGCVRGTWSVRHRPFVVDLPGVPVGAVQDLVPEIEAGSVMGDCVVSVTPRDGGGARLHVDLRDDVAEDWVDPADRRARRGVARG